MTTNLSVHEIPSIDSLDAITVFFQDFEQGKGRMVVECYGLAWASYWGAMGNHTIREFVMTAGSDYLVNKLSRPKQTKAEEKYLRRVVDAVKASLK